MRDYAFGNLVTKLRTELGFSQFQLGKLIGVSDKAVSKWETATQSRGLQLAAAWQIFWAFPWMSFYPLLVMRGEHRWNRPKIIRRRY